MKTWLMLAVMLVIYACSPQAGHWRAKAQRGIDEQLALMLTPLTDHNKRIQGIVTVQFQLSEEGRICRVRVYAHHEALNAHLIRQLTGQKLQGLHTDFETIHTIKVHF